MNRNEIEKYESEYAANGEGCFIFEVQKPGGGWVCIDATRAYGTIGRLVNHSPNPNVKGRVAVVEGKLRMGFLAMKELKKGDEVLVDYGRQRNPPSFMRRTGASVLTLRVINHII